MTKFLDYFHTDWAAMSLNDWIGVFFTVAAFLAMVVVYVMVFNPRNKDALNSLGDIPFRDEAEYNNSGEIK